MAKISQNISSESLFHFIKRRDWLVDVLKSKSFQARYVFEDLPELQYKVGIPMKCFCDIPLGLIKKHLNRYGKFGIGVSKAFAKKNYLSPILYFHDKSDTFFRYISTANKHDIFKNEFSLIPYFKVDVRVIKRTDGKKTTNRYYDEREWRFVPTGAEFIDLSNLDDFDILNRLNIQNEILAKNTNEFLLPFEYHEITYIFVQFDDDVDKVIEEIRLIKISQLQQDRLISKIITSRQIERDF